MFVNVWQTERELAAGAGAGPSNANASARSGRIAESNRGGRKKYASFRMTFIKQ